MDRLDAMATLLAVVDTGSFTAASRKLHVPITTVSRRIAELEAHLRTRLLQRTTRKLTLTDAGIPYIAACRSVIEQLEEAERAAAGEYQSPRGDLTISAPLICRAHLLPVIAEFLTQFVDIRVNFRFTDHLVDLHDDRIDVAIRVGNLPDSNRHARRVGTMHRIVCASPDYLARRGEPKSLTDLDAHDCICNELFDPQGIWRFVTPTGVADVPVRPRVTFNTTEATIDAGLAGLGLLRVYSALITPAIRAGDLRPVLSEFPQPGVPVHLLHDGASMAPLKVRAFVDFCAPRMQARIMA